ncbi:MAG: GtrA family protein [Provencibacterium sp.]|nr:GtrA family protein [Provencibacterium sp.]
MKTLIKKLINRETILYGIFGVMTTVLNIALFQILLFTGMDYRIANVITLLVTKLAAYVVNKLFVFRSRCENLSGLAKEFGRFVITRGATMLLDYFGLIILVELLGVNQRIGKYITTIGVIVINYFLGKKTVFKDSRNK